MANKQTPYDIAVSKTVKRIPVPVPSIRQYTGMILRNEGCQQAAVHIVVIGNTFMTRLNREYLSCATPTDVISFPLHAPGEPVEGEIYISLDETKKQAVKYGISIRNEFLRLCIHGILHLLGYTDTTRPAQNAMTQKENLYLRLFKEL